MRSIIFANRCLLAVLLASAVVSSQSIPKLDLTTEVLPNEQGISGIPGAAFDSTHGGPGMYRLPLSIEISRVSVNGAVTVNPLSNEDAVCGYSIRGHGQVRAPTSCCYKDW